MHHRYSPRVLLYFLCFSLSSLFVVRSVDSFSGGKIAEEIGRFYTSLQEI